MERIHKQQVHRKDLEHCGHYEDGLFCIIKSWFSVNISEGQ